MLANMAAGKKLLTKLDQIIKGKYATWGIFVAGFLESSFLPVPLEVILVPAFLKNRKRAWIYATLALAGCLLAAATFYAIGALLYGSIGQDIVQILKIEDQMGKFQRNIQVNGFWLVATISLFPLPIQVATLGSGAFGYSFLPFMAAILGTRLLRYHGLAAITLLVGPGILDFLKNSSPLWTIALTIAAILLLIVLAGFTI